MTYGAQLYCVIKLNNEILGLHVFWALLDHALDNNSMHSSPGFVATSRFVIANGMEDEVKTAFRNRLGLVDSAQGFLRMDVLSPMDRPQEIWLLTFWENEECYETWHHSHVYHDSHKGIPKGLKLVPAETEIRSFEYVGD